MVIVRRALRGIGIALILLPEPFTTAVGLVLLGMALLLSGIRQSSRPYLRKLIALYINQSKPHSQPAKIIHHKLRLSLPQYDCPRQSRFIGKKATHHVLDSPDASGLRYGEGSNGAGTGLNIKLTGKPPSTAKIICHSLARRWAYYDWPRQPATTNEAVSGRIESHSLKASPGKQARVQGKADKLICHSLKHNLSGYVRPSVQMAPVKTAVHCIDMDKLRRQFEKAPAASAGHDRAVDPVKPDSTQWFYPNSRYIFS